MKFAAKWKRVWPAGLLIGFFGLCVLILFPVYRRAVEQARPHSCQSNLKQIWRAIRMYQEDYDERLPLAVLNPASSTQANPSLAYGWADAQQPYLGSPEPFQCFEASGDNNGPFKPWQSGYTDYFLNSQLAGTRAGKLKFIENTVLLAEGNDDLDIADARYAMPSLPPLWRENAPAPSHRHLGGANYAFVDGHVKWFRHDHVPGTQAPRVGVFTFRP